MENVKNLLRLTVTYRVESLQEPNFGINPTSPIVNTKTTFNLFLDRIINTL